ncbi:MAG: hypothetical protein APF76_04415 [Desulfitibacter sp. BRH_c19]|nr:MAG: hypothetical protein APF76_04415 [Desulfitibacter sp. BRH_c19]
MSGLHLCDIDTTKVSNRELIDEFLKMCKVSSVEVSSKENCWTIHIEFIKLFRYRHLQMFSKALMDCSESLKKVTLIPYYDLSMVNLDQIGNEEVNLIKENLYWLLPDIKIWLMNADLAFMDSVLQFQLPSKMGVEILCKGGYEKLINHYMRTNFKVTIDVEIKQRNDAILPKEDNLLEQYVRKVQMANQKSANSLPALNDTNNSTATIYGKPQKKCSMIGISQLGNDQQKKVATSGEIFNVETIKLKNGNNMISFNITDMTDSITVKIFEKDNMMLNHPLTNGLSVRVVGDVQYDRYSGEQIIIAKAIEKCSLPGINDNAQKKRIELHIHTKFSSMDGLCDIDACVERAAKWGHKAVAITDHGVVQGFPNAFAAGRKYGVKIIYGVEGYLIKDDKDLKKSTRYHIIIFAKNKIGLENLYRLVSLSHLEYYYRKPLIPQNILQEYKEGLVLGTACEAGELIQSYINGEEYEKLKEVASSYDFLEIQPNANNNFLIENGVLKSDQDLQIMNETIVRLGKDMSKPVVATGDVHFLNDYDEIFRKILMMGQGYKDDSQAPLYYRTTQQMLDEFAYLDLDDREAVVIDNPHIVADMIEELAPIPSGFFPPKIDGAEDEISNMTWSTAKKIYGDPLPEIITQRINRELDSIISNGYAVLYLISHKLVKKSNEDGFLVGSRGSVGSSLVATFTGITEVNPLPPHYLCENCKYSEFITDGSVGCGADLVEKLCPECSTKLNADGHQIPFEVFMGFKGDKVPDIDLNFSGEYQTLAHKYTEELFGSDKVFRAGTIGTVAEKTAFGFVKNYLEESNAKCRLAERDRLIKNCTGVKRTTGQHPGGLMIVPHDKDIYAFTPIQRPADDTKSNTITTHFDYHSIHDCLVKLDILGHDDPTVIKMLEDFTGIDAKKIPLNHQETMGIFSGVGSLKLRDEKLLKSSIGTIGIPEFGTKFVRGMLEDTKPSTFAELVRISGLSHGTDVWLNNAQNLIKTRIATLNETIACRDDIMVYLIEKGLPPLDSFKIMEDVRKGKGLKKEYIKLMKTWEVPDWYIDSCEKIKYMFPKAHAVAYVTMAFKIAFFKVIHPEAFYAAFFSVRGDDFDAEIICQGEENVLSRMQEIEGLGNEATAKEKGLYNVLEVALEMYLRGIKLKMINLWESDSFKFKIANGELLCPFISLQGLGDIAAKKIVEVRASGEIRSIEDLQKKAKLTKTVVQVLKDNGILKELPEKNQLTLF